MVATRPRATPAEALAEPAIDVPAVAADASSASGAHAPAGLPAFVALIQSGPRRATARTPRPSSDMATSTLPDGAEAVDAVPSAPAPEAAAAPNPLAAGRATGTAGLHPAWLEAIPASIDDLKGTPPPVERETGTGPVREPVELGARHRVSKLSLPGGTWPWAAWVAYVATVGSVTFVALYGAALVRLLLPRRQRLWAFRTRRAAARYLMATTTFGLLAAGAFAVVPAGGRGASPSVLPDAAATTTVPIIVEARFGGTGASADAPARAVASEAGDAAKRALEFAVAEVTATGIVALAPAEGTSPPANAAELVALPSPADAPAPPASPAPATAAPSSPALPALARVIVANTGGRGVAFRNSPSWDDRAVPKAAYREGTTFTVATAGLSGDDGAGGATEWLQVRDASGRAGFVPARFTRPR